MATRGGRGGGRVMEEGYWLERNPGKTSEDYNTMLLYHGGRGGDIGGGNFIADEEGVPRNYAGGTKPGWKPSQGAGVMRLGTPSSASKNVALRRGIEAKRSLITG